MSEVPDFRELGKRLSNWGRWGPDDQIGTLNFITPDKVTYAASLIRRGEVFQLGIPVGSAGPQTGLAGRTNPVHLMCEIGQDQNYGPLKIADDYIFMPVQSVSQWDALAHAYYDDQLYNGYPASSTTVHGASKNSIDQIKNGITGRGVLIDVAAHRNVAWMQVGEIITPEELDEVVAAQGVEIRSGDIVLVRTGWWAKFVEEQSALGYMSGEPGLGLSCATWLKEHEIAAVASDNAALEVQPILENGYLGSEIEGVVAPLHMVLIRDMGMTIGEILDLEALSRDCASDGVYEFFFSGPPLPITMGVGSPINPVAIK